MSARPQVTITLGRSGQIVKKAGHISDVSQTDYLPSSGSKRSIRERLHNNVDDPYSSGSQYRDKRRRTEDHRWSPSDDALEDVKRHMPSRRVGRDDLRFKLIHKSLSKRNSTVHDKRNGDLREKLSRHSHGPLRFDAQERASVSREAGLVRRIPPTRSAEDLHHLDSLRKSYSFTSNGPRHRSPDRLLGASRRMSPPRSYDNLRHVPSVRSVDVQRTPNFITRSVGDASRTQQLANKASIPVEPSKPVQRAPLTSSALQKASYMCEEPHSVTSLLNSLGLGKYAILFQAEEVDMAALRQMGDNDLKELGIPMGPRKKILLAVLPRMRQRQS